MKLKEQVWSFDSRDLMRSQCTHCTKLSIARELGLPGLADLLAEFYEPPTGIPLRYGIAFEEALEKELLIGLGDLVQAPKDRSMEATLELMAAGVPVIYQGTLRGGTGEILFSGRPDFLLREDFRFEFSGQGLTALQVQIDEPQNLGPYAYSAWDVKLSQTPKLDYQNQVGLYLDVLQQLGLASSGEHGLLLGSRKVASFASDVLHAQLLQARSNYFKLVNEILAKPAESIKDLGSLVCAASSYCDLCEYPALCEHMRRETGHLQLVAGITKANIQSLAALGVTTIQELATYNGDSGELSPELLRKLKTQSRLQVHTYETGEHVFEVINREVLTLLPQGNPGDLFFDIEGFTFFSEPGGLEYLWGFSDAAGTFTGLWADNRLNEKRVFSEFMAEVLQRQKKYPGAKVYHYANYEQAAMKRLSKRYGVYEAELQSLLSSGVFVDLYKTVKEALLLSQESYSIKKLENYYTFERSSSVKEAMGSMEYYDQYLDALETDPAQAEMLKRQVLAYNQDDCASTLALYKFLKTI